MKRTKSDIEFVNFQAKIDGTNMSKLIIPPCKYSVQIEIPEQAFEHTIITVLRNEDETN